MTGSPPAVLDVPQYAAVLSQHHDAACQFWTARTEQLIAILAELEQGSTEAAVVKNLAGLSTQSASEAAGRCLTLHVSSLLGRASAVEGAAAAEEGVDTEMVDIERQEAEIWSELRSLHQQIGESLARRAV